MSSNFEKYSVTERRTGRKICECSDEQDAIMMIKFDPDNRSYYLDKFILDQIIDVSSTTNKQLPGQQGLPEGQPLALQSEKIKLSGGEGKPINIYL
jgi:hypothetical protein